MKVTARRADGTLVGVVNGLPYHFIPGEPLWEAAQQDARGRELPLFVEPEPLTLPVEEAPTLEGLQAQVRALQAQIDAFSKA